MSTKRGVRSSLISLVLLLGVADTGWAQPYDPAIDVQLFEYAVGPKSFLTVDDADVAGKDQFTLDFLLTFLTKPFSIFDVDANGDEISGTRTNVVETLLAGQLAGSYGINEKLQLGATVPLVFAIRGEGLDPATGGPLMGDSLSATGFGDMRLSAKYLAWKKDRMRLSGIGALTLPTSFGAGGSDFLGDDLPSVRFGGAFQWTDTTGKLSAGANLALIFRKPRTIYSSEIGQQFKWGAAGAFKATDRFSLIGELFGRSSLLGIDLDSSPLEAGLGARVRATPSISVVAGAGAGLVRGIGSPRVRVFASVGWAPDHKDDDNDGVVNLKDKCPLVPEDRDGFEDGDGCPDPDNDGDKRLDAEDKCPNKAEDFDGFEDEDGCPELDNDKDGIPDLKDRCPNDAEDKLPPFPKDGCPANKRDSDADGVTDLDDQCPKQEEDNDGFEDWDGCPDLDNDKDGIKDVDDKCPLCPEDKDGFEDDDGCPDFDNDKDGILDAKDQCPLKKETINGIDDFDGCPDTGGRQLVAMNGDRLVVAQRPAFKRGKLLPAGVAVVDQMALLMMQQPAVTKWLLVVAAPRLRNDETTRKLSQYQAKIIKAQLVARGIPASILDAAGALAPQPKVGVLVRARGSLATEGNEFSCPGIKAIPRPKPEKADGAATTAPATVADKPKPKPEPVAVTPPAPVVPKDTDGDGITDDKDQCPDKAENKNNYQDDDGCPDTIPKAVAKFAGNIKGIQFHRGSAKIKRSSTRILKSAARALVKFKDLQLTITGYTDSAGKRESNVKLSRRRAESVKAFLAKRGVAAERMTAVGLGPDNPVASNKTRKGRAKNRRVVFTFQSKAP